MTLGSDRPIGSPAARQALKPPTIVLPAEFGERVGELIDWDRHRPMDVARGVLLSWADVGDRHVTGFQPAQQLVAGDLGDVIVAQLGASGSINLGHMLRGNVAQLRPQRGHITSGKLVVETASLLVRSIRSLPVRVRAQTPPNWPATDPLPAWRVGHSRVTAHGCAQLDHPAAARVAE